MDEAARHLALLTRTTEVVNSSLDLQDVLEAIAHEVAAALETDACFVYLYDERADELVLRATHGTRIENATSAPRMRSGIGITGVAAAAEPVIPSPRRIRGRRVISSIGVPCVARSTSSSPRSSYRYTKHASASSAPATFSATRWRTSSRSSVELTAAVVSVSRRRWRSGASTRIS